MIVSTSRAAFGIAGIQGHRLVAREARVMTSVRSAGAKRLALTVDHTEAAEE